MENASPSFSFPAPLKRPAARRTAQENENRNTKSSLQDAAVIQTNDDAAASKLCVQPHTHAHTALFSFESYSLLFSSPQINRSAIRLGYWRDDFLHHFVRAPTRRPPLFNRGGPCSSFLYSVWPRQYDGASASLACARLLHEGGGHPQPSAAVSQSWRHPTPQAGGCLGRRLRHHLLPEEGFLQGSAASALLSLLVQPRLLASTTQSQRDCFRTAPPFSSLTLPRW